MVSDVDSTRDQLCALGRVSFGKRRDYHDSEGVPNFRIRDLCLLEGVSDASRECESL